MKKLFLLLLPISIYAQSYDALFLGNSYTFYNQLPTMVSEIATSMGDTLQVQSNTPGGWRLLNHAEANSSSMQKIRQQDWDFVILQAQSQESSLPPWQVEDEVYPYAQALVDSIYVNNSCTEPVFFMTWGRKNGDSMNGPSYPSVATYDGMQQRLRESYLQMGMDNDATVAPVGMAWKKSINDNPNFELYTGDESHPNQAGSYLAACVIYSTIFQKSCVGSTFLPPSGLTEEEAATLQNIASSVVLDSTDVWNMFTIQSADTLQLNDSTYSFSMSASNTENIEWDFGDGTTANSSDATHSFTEGQHTVVLSVFTNDYCLQKTIIYNIDIEGSSDNTNVYYTDLNNKLKIFPTPANNYITIEGVAHDSDLKIYNLLGDVVLEQKVKHGERIYLSSLTQAGQYIVEIRNGDEVTTFKLTKNE